MAGPCSILMDFDYTKAKLRRILPFSSYFCSRLLRQDSIVLQQDSIVLHQDSIVLQQDSIVLQQDSTVVCEDMIQIPLKLFTFANYMFHKEKHLFFKNIALRHYFTATFH